MDTAAAAGSGSGAEAGTTAASGDAAAHGTRRLLVLERHLNPVQVSAHDSADLQQQHILLHQLCAATAVHASERQLAAGTEGSCNSNTQSTTVCSHQLQLRARFQAPLEHVSTLHDNWEAAIARYPHAPALGWRARDAAGKLGQYMWMTYAQVGEARTAIGAGLLQLGIPPGSAIGLYSINCKEWVLLDAAAHAYSMISVPLYDSLGADAVQYIINHADLAAVGCSTTVLPKLLSCLDKCPTVKLVVTWDLQSQSQSGSQTVPQPCSGSRLHSGAQGDVRLESVQVPNRVTCRVVTLADVEQLGRAYPHEPVPPIPGDLATICYTSGTTGTPKGAVLTHANLIANAAGCAAAMGSLTWGPGDKHLSFLPLAHIFERKNLTVCVHFGCSIGFYSGNPRAIFQDAQVLQPDMFMAVPRLYNRFYDEVMADVKSSHPLQRRLFEKAYAYKATALGAGDLSGGPLAPVLDKLVFSRIRQRLGGRVRYMTTGSSPIHPQVLMFLRVCFGGNVFEGYGMTETGCTISIARQGDSTAGHVGVPVACCEVKLVDVPDMGYCTTDLPYPRGEVCVRGPSVFQGYHKEALLTAALLDADGWFHTGDIGEWLPGSRLRLIDRKKNLFKLSQGEYVAPEKLESVYVRSPFLLQVFVHGDSFKDRVVAVAVPDPQMLLRWAEEHNLPGDLAALCDHPVVAQAVLDSMIQQAQDAQLQGYEIVAAVRLVPEPFTVECGLLTPTLKLRRAQAKEHFRAAVDAMYAQVQRSMHSCPPLDVQQ